MLKLSYLAFDHLRPLFILLLLNSLFLLSLINQVLSVINLYLQLIYLIPYILLIFQGTLSQWLNRFIINNRGCVTLLLFLKLTLISFILQLGQLNEVKLSLPRILQLSQLFDPRQAIMKEPEGLVPLSLLLDPLLVPSFQNSVYSFLKVKNLTKHALLPKNIDGISHLSPLILGKKEDFIGSFDEIFLPRPQSGKFFNPYLNVVTF